MGYSRHDYKNNQMNNSCTGVTTKQSAAARAKSTRDHNVDYEPQILKKHRMDVCKIEDKEVLFLYSQGTSTRDIERIM